MFTFSKRHVVELLLKEYEEDDAGAREASADEIRVKNVIKDVLDTYALNPCTDIEQECTLVFYRKDTRDDDEDSTDSHSSESSYLSEHRDDNIEDKEITMEYKRKAVAFWNGLQAKNRKKGKKKRSLSCVQTIYRKVKSLGQLKRWEKSVNKGGTKNEKYKAIADRVLLKFANAIEDRHVIVHDIDLRKWGIEAAREVGMPEFKASPNWCYQFKKKNGIGSRKVTKFVTRTQIENQEEISTGAKNFVAYIKTKIETVGTRNTYNSDQSGFNIEMHSGRSLEYRGVRKVEKVVQSVNSTTHSYTIQPTMNAEGELLGRLLLVLAEPSGCFGPKVQRNMFEAPNLMVVATKSGKCTKGVLQKWYREEIRPAIKEDAVFLLDSYGGFNSAADSAADSEGDSEEENTENAAITILRIPKHTTGQIQPWDVLGFRPYKQLDRRISDLIVLNNEDFSLQVRNNIIILQSLCYSLIKSPRFREMLKMGWFKAGYTTNHPAKFQTPVQYCFPTELKTCCRENCEAFFFIRCSWCAKFFCFAHFFKDYQLCDDFVE